MKNLTKLLLFTFALVLSFQFAVACDSHHNSYSDLNADDGVIVVIREVPETYNYDNHEWENEDRYPVYDYRYGYSYRATSEYQEYHERRVYYGESDSYYDSYHSSSYKFQYRPNVYYTYDDYMRKYTAHECYVNPPYNQLIYVRCP